ncbi:hypothetical protein BX600DRAFT_72219 [Xylariales sp. PMI_506]|nr:hypothetical protein BX600DRAFT_72219 [Xylariales sp. PMI_506]
MATKADSEQQHSSSPTLSVTESARFQRAFFCHELCSLAIPVSFATRPHSIFSALEQYALFLSRMRPWEVEEISCVHYYFKSRVRDLVHRLEDHVVGAVLATPGVVKPSDSARASSPDPPEHKRYPISTVGTFVDDSIADSSISGHDSPLNDS